MRKFLSTFPLFSVVTIESSRNVINKRFIVVSRSSTTLFYNNINNKLVNNKMGCSNSSVKIATKSNVNEGNLFH